MPIYSPTGYLDITNATLRTSNIETSNIKIGSANLFITTGNVSDEVFQFTNVTTGLVTTGNVEIGGSIIAPDGVTDIKSNLIVEGNVEAAALRLNSVSISPVYTIASGSGTIDFQGSPTSLTASANIEVGGNVIAQRFEGDGSGLTGIPPNAITGTLSQWSDGSNNDVYIASNVGIGNVHTLTSNTLQVGGNLYVRDTDSNVLTVQGNVSANYFEGDGSKLTGLVTTLESVGNIGNSTSNVIQFTNETTGFVTDANAVIGSNLTISGLTAQKIPYVDAQKVLRDSYITTTTSTGTTSIDSNLSVTGNMFVYGERFFIESESQLLKDPIIGLANNNVDQNIDIGILMQRPTSNVGIIHHGGTNELTLGYTQSNLTAAEITNDLSQELTVNVIGNVITQNNLSVGGTFKINTISAASSHSLAAVSNVGNTTSNVIQFTNPETSLVASSNIVATGNVSAGYDTNTTSYFGRAAVGYMGQDDHASFAHVSHNTTSSYALKQTAGGPTYINTPGNGHIRFTVNDGSSGAEKMRITGAGRIGIGTTSPQEKLHVYGAPMIQHDTAYQYVDSSQPPANPTAWYKLGEWEGSDSNGQGANLKLTLLGGSGYHGPHNNKSGETVIHAKLLNNQDTSVANIGGMFYSIGNPVVHQVKFKQVDNTNRNKYEVHAEVVEYTQHNMSIECSMTSSFTRSFTSTGVDPGTDSSTVRAAKFTHIINESGYLGIGTTSPQNMLHVYKANNDETSGILIEKAHGGLGTAASLFFGVASTAETNNIGIPKAAIFYERNLANGRGDIKFCNDAVDDTNPVSTAASDTRMIIKNNGDVGVGTVSPSGTLDVSSTRTGFSDLAAATNEATLMISCTDPNAADDGDIGGGIVFRQRWFNANAGLVPTGGIYGYKDRNNGSFGGGLLFTRCPDGGVGGALVETMRITKEGYIKYHNQARFSAYSTNGDARHDGFSSTNIQGATPGPFVLGNTFYNVGSHYSTSTGAFTAPIGGHYRFSLTIFNQYAQKQYSLWYRSSSSGTWDDIAPYKLMSASASGDETIWTIPGSQGHGVTIDLYVPKDYQIAFGGRGASDCTIYRAHSYFSGELISIA